MFDDFDVELVNAADNKEFRKYLLDCNFGLERENIRVDKTGTLAMTSHPNFFGDRMKNPYIKTDFSESQIEMATPVKSTIDETYCELEKIHDFVSSKLDNEYLWPQSTPPNIPEGCEIPIANMGDYEEEKFRYVLAEKYGRKQQLYCGIHYNFSFKEEYLNELYKKLMNGETYTEFKNNVYLKICRNFLKYRWLLIYLTGTSPVFHKSFAKEYVKKSTRLDSESCYFPDMISLRNSNYGYKNRENYQVPFDTVNNYTAYIDKLVSDNKLQSICEFYGPVRLKTGNNDDLSHELLEFGIKYIELRIFDLNPLFKNGISRDELYFIHIFALYMLFKKEDKFTEEDYEIGDMNAQLISFYGLKKDILLYDRNNTRIPFLQKAQEIINGISEMLKILHIESEYFTSLTEKAQNTVKNSCESFASQILKGTQENSFISFHMKKVLNYNKKN